MNRTPPNILVTPGLDPGAPIRRNADAAHIAVIGAGSWGTALAIQAVRAGATVTLWARDPARAATRHKLPDPIHLTDTLPERADLTLLAIPMQHLRAVAARLRPGAPLVACAKGIEADTLRLPLELLAECHPQTPSAFLTGPNFASEIAAGLPAAAVVAATDPALRSLVLDRLASPNFRLYGNDDPIGAQIGAAAKNVIAIGAGVVLGAGFGENARAALVTRGLAELGRCVAALGGRAETVAGLSGLGDLLLTCTSATSRNCAFGIALGRGQSIASALAASRGVVEGVATAPALLARAGAVELPICRAVADLIEGRMTVDDAARTLMGRKLRDE